MLHLQRLRDPADPARGTHAFPVIRTNLALVPLELTPAGVALVVRWMAADNRNGIVVMLVGRPTVHGGDPKWCVLAGIAVHRGGLKSNCVGSSRCVLRPAACCGTRGRPPR